MVRLATNSTRKEPKSTTRTTRTTIRKTLRRRKPRAAACEPRTPPPPPRPPPSPTLLWPSIPQIHSLTSRTTSLKRKSRVYTTASACTLVTQNPLPEQVLASAREAKRHSVLPLRLPRPPQAPGLASVAVSPRELARLKQQISDLKGELKVKELNISLLLGRHQYDGQEQGARVLQGRAERAGGASVQEGLQPRHKEFRGREAPDLRHLVAVV
eukprot:3499737-Pleurochrysis_carterae.AAC.3